MLVKQLLGEASPEENQAVQQWLEEDAANKIYYGQLQKIWDSSKQLAAVSAVDENRAWERFQQRIHPGKTTAPVIGTKRFSWMKVAASVIVLLGLALGGFLLLNGNSSSKVVIAQTTQNTLTQTLSDGSVVTLNKKSSVTYPSKFKGAKRAVTLKGEAFFTVTPDKKKPFIITVNDVQVEVVGTSFNIKEEEGTTEVLVETGIVRVTHAGQTVELKAGERIRLGAGIDSAEKEKVSDKLYNYYRSREFVCDNTPLWKLVEVLNRAYEVKIRIGRKELNELRINTTFNNESLDKVLEIIGLTFEIDIVRKDGEIILQ